MDDTRLSDVESPQPGPRRRSPTAVPVARSLYARGYEGALFPLWQRIVRGRRIHEYGSRLARTQWLDPEPIERLQAEALRVLLAHAGTHVPYYRELFSKQRFDPRAVRSRADLLQLPLLTRDIVRERYDDLIDATEKRAIRKETSGTTGVPLRFEYCNASESWRQAIRLRAYGWAGYRLGLPTLHYWGTGTRVLRGAGKWKTSIDRALMREVYVDAVLQTPSAMRRTAELLSRMRPHAIVAYTQALANFARWVTESGSRDWEDTIVIGGAEPMLARDRAAIARVFGSGIYETYGSRETMLIAAECEAHDGLHLVEENLVVEIVRNGVPAEPRESGQVVVTDLHNFRMPFIRYANGDEAMMGSAERCACGRGLRRLERVEGRCTDTLIGADGAPVPGMLFISLLNTHEAEIRAFQAVQKASGAVELRIVPGREWSEDRFAVTARRLADYFRGLPFAVKLVDEIPADASGKRRPVAVEKQPAPTPQ
jgi:phenylacetate-CoA ligase